MVGLTARQRECLALIETSIATRGYPPSLKEIGAAMSISSNNGVNDHLRYLTLKGYIARDPKRARAIRVLIPSGQAR